MKFSRPTFAEVNLTAIRQNVQAIRAQVGGNVRILAAVKADGYGHGAIPAANACLTGGVDLLGVASVDEGVELRDHGIESPILILSATLPEEAEACSGYRLTPTVASREVAESLNRETLKREEKLSVHVKVDTGMGRVGVWHEDALDFFNDLAGLCGLTVAGVYTHFPSADEKDKSFTLGQVKIFREIVETLRRGGLRFLAHTANSGAILDLPESYFDLVRPGLILYGAYPSDAVSRSITLRPAMTLKSRIQFLKRVGAGRTLSYGRTYATSAATIIATVPVGYADGYSRAFSNRGQVLVRGRRCPIVGRVSMDQCLVDVGGVKGARVGDDVVFFGIAADGKRLTVEEVASTIGTIPNEVLCWVSRRVPRVYIG